MGRAFVRRRGRVDDRRWWALGFAVVLTASLLLVGAPSLEGSAKTVPSAVGSGVQPARLCTGCYVTHPSGNFSLSLTGPNVGGANRTVPNGTVLTVAGNLQVPNFADLDVATLTVSVPTIQGQFPVSRGTLDVTVPATTLNITSSAGTGGSSLEASVTLPATTFPGSTRALFTTSIVSVTTQLPWGSVSLNVSWRYGLTTPGGSVNWTNWSAPKNVVPDQYLGLAGTSPLTMAAGMPFTACVEGAVAGRELSLHAEIPNPYFDFHQVNVTLPPAATGPFCWSVPIPARNPNNNTVWPDGEPLIVHVWDYQHHGTSNITTLLLYVLAVTLVPGHVVTFHEKGLPAGRSWNVTMNGATIGSTTTSLKFHEPNGSYAFQVGDVPGWTTTESGTAHVAGANLSITRTFVPRTYEVTFHESGLAGGTNWSVVVAGTALSSASASIVFHLANGSYPYSVSGVANHSLSTPSGLLLVDGSWIQVNERFSRVTYQVTFAETGLPLGTNWSITIGSRVLGTTSTEIQLPLPNGTYPYSVPSVLGHAASRSTGAITVSGRWVKVSETFS